MRLNNILLKENAYGVTHNAPMLTPAIGGQFGFMEDYTAFVSATPDVSKPLVAVLMEAPRAFKDISNGNVLTAILRALLEDMPKTIEGLVSTQTTEFASVDFGGAGQKIYMPMNATREESRPNYTYDDRYGKAVQKFYTFWSEFLLMDPSTKFPQIIARNNGPKDLLLDYISATTLYYEPDPTNTKVVDAWLCMGMMPQSSGTREGRRDLVGGGQAREVQIEFTATTQVGSAVMQMAQRIMDQQNRTGMNANLRQAYIRDIEEDVKAAKTGYVEGINKVANSGVRA